MIKTNIPKV